MCFRACALHATILCSCFQIIKEVPLGNPTSLGRKPKPGVQWLSWWRYEVVSRTWRIWTHWVRGPLILWVWSKLCKAQPNKTQSDKTSNRGHHPSGLKSALLSPKAWATQNYYSRVIFNHWEEKLSPRLLKGVLFRPKGKFLQPSISCQLIW